MNTIEKFIEKHLDKQYQELHNLRKFINNVKIFIISAIGYLSICFIYLLIKKDLFCIVTLINIMIGLIVCKDFNLKLKMIAILILNKRLLLK